jgi:hypothetical protein
MLIVISPAKTLDYTSNCQKINHSLPALLKESQTLIAGLRKKSTTEIAELMNISEKLAELNATRYHDFSESFNEKNSRPAIFAFKGEVYQGLAVQNFDSNDLNHAQKHLRILSGLYGVLRPLDLMQPYRLEMGTELKTNRGKNLYEFWGDIITDTLNKEKSDLLINLASNEYFKAVNEKKLASKLLHITFKEKQGDEYKIIGLFAKKARGKMARFIIKNRINKMNEIKDFTEDGYALNKKLTTENNFVFTRSKKS